MNPNNAPEASWMFVFFLNAVDFLKPAVNLIGLGVAIWAFLRCRKRGYLVIALYFGLVLFSLFVMPSINRVYRAHHQPDITEQEQQKMNAAVQQAIDQVITEEGHPVAAPLKVNFEIGPMVLVAGLWLIARKEPRMHRLEKGPQPTEAASGS
jgi:hypothetical protein